MQLALAAILMAQLWPGSNYSIADRDKAVDSGIRFLESVASDPRYAAGNSEDLLWCFYTMSVAAGNPGVRKTTGVIARKLALDWQRLHTSLPPHATPDDLVNYATAVYAANQLGIATPGLREQMRAAAATFSVQDFFGFNPKVGPPTAGRSRYDAWCDALITAQAGALIGITFGAQYSEVIQWLPAMRPYPSHAIGNHAFYAAVYAVTHVIYTMNNYSVFAVDRSCLEPEWEYLKANLQETIRIEDPETTGEFLDSLRAFGLTNRNSIIQSGVSYVLSKQNPDGSWGNPKDPDIYNRYHSTWTAINGLMEYRFRPARPCPVFK